MCTKIKLHKDIYFASEYKIMNLEMKKTIGILFLFICIVFEISAQGYVRGKIIDAETGESLIGATVAIPGTTKGTITDFDGNYSLTLDPGTYTLSISYVSYETQTFEEVEVVDGEVTIINANLGEATTELEAVVVTARSRQQTESALQVMQRKSAVVMDGISAQQISRLGDSDAAGALKRVTGVSIEGGKYVYVRGLSDRYSKITLNGAEIPGLDPNRNTVQMDLFPANIIENMVIHKTFSPNLPGSFTGGHVDISTKDFPEKFTLQVSASAGYNPNVTFNDDYQYYEGGDLDWQARDDGTRSDHPEIPEDGLPEPFAPNDSMITQFSKAFNKNFNLLHEPAPMDHDFSFSMGNQIQLFGRALGFVGAASYQRSYSTYLQGTYNQYRRLVTEENMTPTWLLRDDRGEDEVIWAGLLNVSYKLSDFNSIGFVALRNQSGISSSRYNVGPQPEEDRNIQNRNLAYLERGFLSYQLKGEHVINGLNKSKIEWITSYTASELDEPDLRFFLNDFVLDPETNDTIEYSTRTNRESKRFFRDMTEINFDNQLDITIPFTMFTRKAKISAGGAYLTKDRGSESTIFTISANNELEYNGNPRDLLRDENIFNEVNQFTGNYFFYNHDELTDQVNSYYADQTVWGTYAMIDFYPMEKLRVVTGLRYEKNDIFTENQVDTTEFRPDEYDAGELIEEEFLPALNFTYSPVDNMNLRLSLSRTIARPSFREIAPYASYDHKAGFRTIGNNDSLRSARINNYDLRWEYFFNPGELVSFSLFYKFFQDPIESIDNPNAPNKEVSYINGQDSWLYGFEIEFRKKLDFIEPLQNFLIGTNFSYIKSVTQETDRFLESARANDPDYPEEREMFGQSPYIVNGYLTYNNENIGLSSNLSYNVAGKKIVYISKFGLPNVYEMPFGLLNFNISKNILESFSLKFSAKNLLNSEFRQAYLSDKIDDTFQSHKFGREYSISLSYLIN